MLTIVGGDYEHTLSVESESGGALRYQASALPQVWADIRRGAPFDVAEFSLANLIMMKDRGADFLHALPIFPNRPFSHIALRVAKTSAIRTPAEFRGKRIGVPDYSMTAAVWARGILRDEFGVDWRDIHWVSGMTQRFAPPAEASLTLTDRDLETLCVDGALDGLLSPHPREEGRPESERKLRTAIADNEAHERAAFLRTGLYPINHCLVISQDALAREPEAPRMIFDAYVKAKRRALARRLGSTFMPWGEARWSEMLETFNGDPFPYGLTDINRQAARKLIDLLADQRLISAAPDLERVFAAESAAFQE